MSKYLERLIATTPHKPLPFEPSKASEVSFEGCEGVSTQQISQIEDPPLIFKSTQTRPPSGAFFMTNDQQSIANELNTQAALEHRHERYCVCGILATNGVGRVLETKNNPEGVKQWLCEKHFDMWVSSSNKNETLYSIINECRGLFHKSMRIANES